MGESGCGKTTTAKMLLLLERPTSGSILFEGEEVHHGSATDLTAYRSSVQAVFQDPWSSLNPRMRVKDLIAEPMVINWQLPKKQVQERVIELLREVGLSSYHANLYPHEFSGGQRQRLAIARALALNPKVIVLDEPVSALDVSIRAQIMNLLKDLQQEHNVSYLLIAHHLATVRYMCKYVAVMYLGQIVEHAEKRELYDNPLHPYTKALMSARPSLTSGYRAGRDNPAGRSAVPAEPSAGVPLPYALPLRDGPVHRGGAGVEGGEHRAPGLLPPVLA